MLSAMTLNEFVIYSVINKILFTDIVYINMYNNTQIYWNLRTGLQMYVYIASILISIVFYSTLSASNV